MEAGKRFVLLMCKLKRVFFLTEVKCNSFPWGGQGVWWGGTTKLIAVIFGEENTLLRLFFCSSSLNSSANLMSLVSYSCLFCSSCFASPSCISVIPCTKFKLLTGPIASSRLMGWSLFWLLLSLPNAFSLLLSHVRYHQYFLDAPAHCVYKPVNPRDTAQSQCPAGVSKQQGIHPWAAVRRNVSLAVGCWKSHVGRKKSKQSSVLDGSVVWNSELFLHLSSRHQLSPVGAITLPCLPGLINLYLPHHQSAKWLFEHYLLPRNPCFILQRGP